MDGDHEDERGDLRWGSIPGLVRAAATAYADREAVVDGRTRISYAQLGERVERAAAACIAAGVEPGDRVAVWAPNSLDWIVSALGAVSAGAVLVPLNTRFKGAEAAYVLGRSRARLLFVTGTFLGTSYVASLRRAAAEGPGEGPLPGLPHLEQVVVLAEDAPESFRTWKDFLAGGDAVPAAVVRARADSVRTDAPSDIIFTSGTTGSPKGAVITHAQTLRCYAVWSELAGLREGDRYLIVNPFFHTFGYKAGVVACLMRGATMVPQPVFDVDTALANIAAERISVLHLPRLTRAQPPPVGTEVRVAGADGRVLGPGEAGEVQVRGHHVMLGYYEDAEETARALTADGWLRTGDVGVLDAAGNLRITDRIKDMFIVGGFNAYPAEIEQLLGLHPDIADVAVVGVPDPRLGEVGKAYAVRRPGATLTADDLIAWSRREMANYKVPREVEFVAELPRNAGGKVLKRELRSRG
ncbi:AMP-binding protein [Streptomyces sp. WAC06614]|uniref:AMP-binding protein n=1 Tax=Streptomyces sp. WAC06614 TaxID=2487416 RepID=UPI000F790505|nr:AMP-binding protein [Streptomyces sp. WAC06614]RSS82336.1 fatty acid--CoA ligase family protein [Streptomyces sp. WAC06614]